MEVRIGPLESCASCASGGAVRAISPDLGESCISENPQSYDWAISEMHDSTAWGELRNGAKTKAGPLEAEQLSRLGKIALVR